jgi:hypothetical protein
VDDERHTPILEVTWLIFFLGSILDPTIPFFSVKASSRKQLFQK